MGMSSILLFVIYPYCFCLFVSNLIDIPGFSEFFLYCLAVDFQSVILQSGKNDKMTVAGELPRVPSGAMMGFPACRLFSTRSRSTGISLLERPICRAPSSIRDRAGSAAVLRHIRSGWQKIGDPARIFCDIAGHENGNHGKCCRSAAA